jgi:metal-responsive CopG/Arc/MetJ family transcriptional regulator
MLAEVGKMRTTVEIPDELRAELLALAAKRGLRGYSEIVKEAIVIYLKQLKREKQVKKQILKLEGIWADEDADKISKSIESAWSRWKIK